MNRFDKMRNAHNTAENAYKASLIRVSNEAERVADIAKNADKILDDIDRQFEQVTKLTNNDVVFLFYAVALQCCRQYLLTDFKERLGDKEAADKTLFKDKVDPHDLDKRKKDGYEIRHHKAYNPTLSEIIDHPVPFDTVKGSPNFGSPLAGGGKLGHRATAIGHDPILGLIFGTANIATSTLTNWEFRSFFILSKTGRGGGDFLDSEASTITVMDTMINKIKGDLEQKKIVVVSLIKEIIHLRSDIHSKNSLPLPVISTVDPQIASLLAEHGFDMENIETVGKQAEYTLLINWLVSITHSLFYNEAVDISRETYKVRTRKIVTYSNVIASASNILYTAISVNLGNKEAARKLDIGGFLVTLSRLISDVKFISSIKKEFLEKEFYKKVMGDVNLMEAENNECERY